MPSTEISRGVVLARAVAWPLVPAGLVAVTWIDTVAAPGPLAPSRKGTLTAATYVVAILAPYAVGVLLTLRVPSRGAG